MTHVCMYVCLFNVLGTKWGPTDRVLFMQIHSFKILCVQVPLVDAHVPIYNGLVIWAMAKQLQ